MKKKLFVFCFTHALPTAFAMSEDGEVVASHGGDSADDAVFWLFHHRPHLEKEYEIVHLDQKLVERHLYGPEPISILGPEVAEAFRKNQELKKAHEVQAHTHKVPE